MTGRAIAESMVGILLGVVLTIVGLGLIQSNDGTDATTAFLSDAPRLLFGVLWPAIIVWVVLIVVGNLRNRKRTAMFKMITNLVSTLVASLLAVIGGLTIEAAVGGSTWLALIALVVAVVFFAATSIGFALTHLVFFRVRPQVG